MTENEIKGDYAEIGKKALAELVPGELSKPLRNAVDNMEAANVSKQMVKQQIGNTEVLFKKVIEDKTKNN